CARHEEGHDYDWFAYW
nr:immunoglobulin heavy chain junction region [Mus musculus]MBK4189394.1 immunoglobulin heavy chain junction region [Mus musculus]